MKFYFLNLACHLVIILSKQLLTIERNMWLIIKIINMYMCLFHCLILQKPTALVPTEHVNVAKTASVKPPTVHAPLVTSHAVVRSQNVNAERTVTAQPSANVKPVNRKRIQRETGKL